MEIAPPATYEEYLNEIRAKVNLVERMMDSASGLDERLDISNRLLIETVKLLSEGLKLQLPSVPRAFPGLPPYSVRKFELDVAKTKDNPEEVQLPGDALTFYTNGSYSGIEFALDSPTNDWIPVIEFGNPYRYPAVFKKIYLSWTAQADKYLRVHVGREAGAAAESQITIGIQETLPDFVHGQTDVGTTVVQLQSTSFSLKLGAVVKADDDNTGNIYVGESGVTTSTGFRLDTAQGLVIEIDNINKIYCISDVASQKVHYIGV